MRLIEKIINNNEVKKLIQVYISQSIVIVFAFIYNLLLSKNLSVIEFGEYRYLINFFIFSSSILCFGFQYSLSKILTKIKNKKIADSFILILILIIIIISLAVYILILFLEKTKVYNIFDIKSLQYNLLFLSIPLIVISLQFALQGMGKIKELAKLNIFIPIFQFILFVFIKSINFEINSKIIATIYLSSNFIAILIILINLNFTLNLKNLKSNFNILYLENKKIGFPIYIGGVFSVGIQNFLNIISKNYSTNLEYGYYSLALTLSMPLTMVASSFGTVLYKKMSGQSFIEKKYIKISIGLVCATYILYCFFISIMFKYFYSLEYINAMYMTFILGLASAILGLGDFFNRFIMVKGYGKELRNNTIILGGLSLILSFLFLKKFQILGMVFIKLINALIYISLMIKLYIKVVKKERTIL